MRPHSHPFNPTTPRISAHHASRLQLVSLHCHPRTVYTTCRVTRAAAPTRPTLCTQDNRAQGTMVVRGPPSVYVAVPQIYMVFLLNGDVYSKAAWVTLRRPESGPALLPLPR